VLYPFELRAHLYNQQLTVDYQKHLVRYVHSVYHAAMNKLQIEELLKANRKQRFRRQRGTVVERTDGFYIRYYRDGDTGRKKITERLCDLNTPPAKVKLLRDSHMSAINNARHTELQSATETPVLTVGAFWQSTYLPWVQANKRASTARGYETDWKIYVKPELETTPIDTYTTVDACELLDRMVLVKKLNENTLAHVKSLCRGIFATACRKGIIPINPWREAKESVKVRPEKTRIAYTPEETVAILNALTRQDAKLFFVLVAVMGMRPSEVAAAKWENMNWKTNVYHVSEAAPYGVLGDTKTERSKRDLTIIEPVLSLLKAWHKTSEKPAAGLLFTNGDGEPVNHNSFSKYHIAPEAKKVCARWCGLYAGRHGAATSLYNLTGDIRAAYQNLGNSLEVVMSTYVKPDVAAGVAGMGKYEAALKKVKR
jgi:integrase